MTADPPDVDAPMMDSLLTFDLRAELDELFYEPENLTESLEDDVNATTTVTPPTTTRRPATTTKPPPPNKWIIPLTFVVGPTEDEDDLENITKVWKNTTENLQNGTWYDIGNETKPAKTSKWAENVMHLIWMNDTEMVIPDLGKHKWVRYNVGARGLYRVAPQDRNAGETAESAAARAAALYESGAPAERALLLDDAFVLSRAGRLPASRAIAAATRLSTEKHWAPWRVVLSHVSWWRALLRLGASGPHLHELLQQLHPEELHTLDPAAAVPLNEDQLWLSGALLTAGVEWENPRVTKQAVQLFDAWYKDNQTIPDIYQEAAFTAGVRAHGAGAWRACWRALRASCAAPRPLHNHRALLAALASAKDDWLFYRFAFTALSAEAQRSREWRLWVTTLCTATCRWRGAAGTWRVLRAAPALPPPALLAAARCLHEPHDYYRFKDLFGEYRGAQIALDTIALNSAWVARADADLLRYFNAVHKH
ncbi:glutamyl aminopeptidase-like [Ostrinia nubilalis]|uniref:glutamyl aminopeptidase-like n=1 Tax=Ostrinia nubilalis TaxID=29057 RepID=UPI00308230E8